MGVSPTDWQCCGPTASGLRCTKPLIYGSHDGPCEHVHDYERCGRNKEETMCGCEPPRLLPCEDNCGDCPECDAYQDQEEGSP
jgi:hypothetical protein